MISNRRLEFHNSNAFKQSFTSQANDWQEYFVIEYSSKQQAIKIEQHIKRMKSRKYLENLKKYPDLLEKMKSRFAAP